MMKLAKTLHFLNQRSVVIEKNGLQPAVCIESIGTKIAFFAEK